MRDEGRDESHDVRDEGRDESHDVRDESKMNHTFFHGTEELVFEDYQNCEEKYFQLLHH